MIARQVRKHTLTGRSAAGLPVRRWTDESPLAVAPTAVATENKKGHAAAATPTDATGDSPAHVITTPEPAQRPGLTEDTSGTAGTLVLAAPASPRPCRVEGGSTDPAAPSTPAAQILSRASGAHRPAHSQLPLLIGSSPANIGDSATRLQHDEGTSGGIASSSVRGGKTCQHHSYCLGHNTRHRPFLPLQLRLWRRTSAMTLGQTCMSSAARSSLRTT